MADSKISALAELLTVDDLNDLLHLIDVSVPGDKKLKLATLIAAANSPIYTLLGSGVEGGAATVKQRIDTISNFASPNAGGFVVGNYYDNAPHSLSSATYNCSTDRFALVPFYTSVPLSIDEIGVACSTLAAGVTCKIVIYSSDANNWPDELLYESTNLDLSTTGWKGVALTFAFESGVQYWVGLRPSGGTARVRAVNNNCAFNLGLSGSNAGSYNCLLERDLAYATPAPASWSFVSTDLVTGNVPSIRFKVAAP